MFFSRVSIDAGIYKYRDYGPSSMQNTQSNFESLRLENT